MRAGLSHYHDDSRNRIQDLRFEPDAPNDPDYSSTINRNPTEAQRQAICGNSQFTGSLSSCLSAPIGAIVDWRLRNTFVLTTSGLDFETVYAS